MDTSRHPAGSDRTAWCAPLEHFGGRALADRVPWPIDTDEFRLIAQIERRDRPTVWTYRHLGSELDLHLDQHGHAYRLTAVTERGRGRFIEIDPRRAVFEAGLHLVVVPIFADGISTIDSWVYTDEDEEDDELDELDELDEGEEPEPTPRRHLVLVPSP